MKRLLFTTLLLALPTLALAEAPRNPEKKENAQEQKAENAAQTKILFLGDSLTEGYGIPMEEAFPKEVEKILEEKGRNVEIINGGQSGATTASGVKRLAWYLRSKPDILVLSLGANDGLRGLSLKETQENLRKIIDRAKSKGITVILSGMKLPPNYGSDFTDRFEEMFPKLAKEENVALIPFLLEGVAGEPEFNLPDQIHPNELGHENIAKTVADKIEEILNASRRSN